MPRSRTYPDDLRDRLIAEATQSLLSGNEEQLSLRRLAAAQGTSTNAIYSLFGGKTELIAAVVEKASAAFAAAQEKAVDERPSLHTLIELGHAYRRWALEQPALYTLLFGRPFEPARLPEATAKPLKSTIAALMESGELRRDDVERTFRSMWASVHGWIVLEIASDQAGVRQPDAGVDEFAAHLERGLWGLASDQGRRSLA